jgi:two-component system chemotaxis response regulator CheB
MPLEPIPVSSGRPGHILVVDDSVTTRMALVRLLRHGSGDWKIAGAPDAEAAIHEAGRAASGGEPFHLVLLDVEMPGMSGLEAVPHLLALPSPPRVMMVASPTRRSAESTFAALAAGASDFVPKPSSRGLAGFERELLSKVAALLPAPAPVARTFQPVSPVAAADARQPVMGARARSAQRAERPAAAEWSSSSTPSVTPIPSLAPSGSGLRVVAIGASTGGPAAIAAVLRGLRGIETGPVVITQHMPAAFLPVFADQLAPVIGRPCAEAEDGAALRPDRVYVAPGERHLLVERTGSRLLTRLDDGPPENFCRPAVDPMFRSVARAFGPAALAVILTGMGQDGADGCAAIRAAGGRVLAQDESSSIVWGMPGAVVRRGLADAVLTLDGIAPAIVAAVRRAGCAR